MITLAGAKASILGAAQNFFDAELRLGITILALAAAKPLIPLAVRGKN